MIFVQEPSGALVENLIAVAANATIGPIRLGQTFSETVRLLGNPHRLGFHYDDMFDGTLVYGPAEIFVQIIDNNVSSYLVQLHLFKRSRGRHLRVGNHVSFDRPKRSELGYERVQKTMLDAGISFKLNSPEKIKNGMHPLMQFNDNVRFYFLPFGPRGSLQLGYIELADYTKDL